MLCQYNSPSCVVLFGRVRGNAFGGLLSARRRAKELDCRYRGASKHELRFFYVIGKEGETDFSGYGIFE
jgi:hypothetical protein